MQEYKEFRIGEIAKVKKPHLVLLENISVNEFFYLQSLSGEVGMISGIKIGQNNKKIYLVSYENKSAYIHADDLQFAYIDGNASLINRRKLG